MPPIPVPAASRLLPWLFVGTAALAAQQATPPPPAAPAPPSVAAAAPAPSTAAISSPAAAQDLTVPAGTRVLLALRSGVNTRTAAPGDSVYLSSTFPVLVGQQVAIPAGVYVQGTIDRVQRAGRVKGRAEVNMHFTTLIFPNGTVVSIPGVLDKLPGAADAKVKDAEGTVQQSGSKGKDAATIARGAETGAGIGAIGGAIGGSPLAGAGYGAVAGGAAGLIYTLLTRGNDVNLEQGQTVEMTLQRPLLLTPSNLASVTGPGAAANLVPAAQPPLHKPDRDRLLLCPPGTLGCL